MGADIVITKNFQDCSLWNNFIKKNSQPDSFLQSWEWGEFNKEKLGADILRWTVTVGGQMKIVCLMIKKDLPHKKSFYYIPRGWICSSDCLENRALAYKNFLRELKQKLTDQIFLRFAFNDQRSDYIVSFLRRLFFCRPRILTRYSEPEQTILINLEQTEEAINAGMKPKTRYNIRLARGKGVTIRAAEKSTLDRDISLFYKLSKETAARNQIKIYSPKYYQLFFDYFFNLPPGGDISLKIYFAEINKNPLAAIAVVYFGKTATYLYGASADNERGLMPGYLVHWQAIKEAKERGLLFYDFWGVSDSKASWAGITRFKKSFGGQPVNFLGTWDYPLRPSWYYLFYAEKIIKNKVGGLLNFLRL